MAKRVQRRRGTTSEHGSFTGFEGEITVDTTIDTLRVHDGSLAGGHALAKADGSNLTLTNAIGIVQLNVTDGDAGEFLQTDGNNNLSFEAVDVGGTALGGSKLGGTISNATIDVNAVGVSELAVTEAGGGGSAGHFLRTDGAGTLSFAAVVTDPTLTGDIGGTTSANVIGAGKLLYTHLSTALKNFTVDSGTGSAGVDTFNLSAAPGSVNSVIAYIDGIVQPPSAYALLTSPNRLVFTTAPSVGSIIRIVHLGFQSTVGVPSDGSITNAKLATNSVESDNIVNGTIATDDIANNAITDAKIAANTITAASIAANVITNVEIANSTITGTQIADNTIDGTKINIAGNVQGDVMHYDGTNWVRLGPGTSGYALTTGGANANPSWTSIVPGTTIPTGLVALWSGATNAIPSGWLICDGTNSTPDLRDKFIVGAGSTYAVNATGGSTSTASHTLTIAELAAHTHNYNAHTGTKGTGDDNGPLAQTGSSSIATTSTGSGSSHTHTGTLPPYYALAYIMKT